MRSRASRTSLLLAVFAVIILPVGAYLALRWALPPAELTVELNADGNVVVFATNAVATIEREEDLSWPRDEKKVVEFLKRGVLEASQDDFGLPECRVRLALDRTTDAATAFHLILLCLQEFVTIVRLEAGGHGVDLQLRRDEGTTAMPALGKPKDRVLGGLSAPEQGKREWTLTEAKVLQVLAVNDFWADAISEVKRARAAGRSSYRESYVPEEVLDMTLAFGLDEPWWVDLMDRKDWQELRDKAVQKSSTAHGRADDLNLDGFDAIYVECSSKGSALDVVRALQMLRTRYPDLKTYLVGGAPGLRLLWFLGGSAHDPPAVPVSQ